MKYLITFLILTNITMFAYMKYAIAQDHLVVQNEARQMSDFYYGFCQDVKESGLGFGNNYHRLCQ